MQLRIRSQHAQIPDDIRAAIDRKLRLAMGRYAARIERATVTLFDHGEDRPTSGCRIRVSLREGGGVTVEDRADDPADAVAAAVWRVGHRMQRQHSARSDDRHGPRQRP